MCAITEEINSNLPTAPMSGHPVHIPRGAAVFRRGASPPPHKEDFLAKFTYSQRQLVYAVSTKWNNLVNSNKLRVLMGSTQPGHIIAVGLVTLVATLCYPAAYSTERPSSVTNLLYLASIAIHIGDQFWMTFISGLALYFSLPRHAFGEVQKVLFPKYFALNTFLSAITLVTFARLHTQQTFSTMQWLQMGSICTCFLTELFIRIYLVPPVIHLISEKIRIEKMEPGVGDEIGYHAPGKLSACPHYMGLHKQFRRYHLCVAMGNILTMVCTTLQLIYIQHNYSHYL